MAFRIDRIVLRQIRMPLVHFFETSFSRTYQRSIVLVEVISDGLSGWGEVTAGEHPFYNEEWTASIWPLLTRLRRAARPASRISKAPPKSTIAPRTSAATYMTRGGLEAAVWDLEARRAGVPLAQHIGGGARTHIPCGVSIGIQDSVAQLLEKIQTEVDAGYQRIKIKIKPGWDIDVVRQVREKFPDILLMADANSAYTLADAAHLKQLDEFNLMMMEQPLAHDDIIDHAILQSQLQTPICLDECIRTPHHAEQAIALARLPHPQHQAGPRRRLPRRQTDSRFRPRPPHSGVVRRHARIRHRPRAQHCALDAPRLHAARRRLRQQALLDARHHRARPSKSRPKAPSPFPPRPGFGYEIDMDYLQSITVREEAIS